MSCSSYLHHHHHRDGAGASVIQWRRAGDTVAEMLKPDGSGDCGGAMVDDDGDTNCIIGGCIDQANVGVVECWGRFKHVAEPGCHFFNPLAGQWLAGVLSTRINSDVAFYELPNRREQIQAYVFYVVRALVPMMTLDALFEQKGEVAKSVLEELEKVMGAYGYSIENILMVDIIPDSSVRKAMNEINAAHRAMYIYACRQKEDK